MLDTAIVGAGPYGLSMAAHLRRCGIPFRIFGPPMASWLAHMPKGMFLKSDGFASNLYDPDGEFTLRHFCAERGIDYADTGNPVSLETFCAYGLAFKERMVPEHENKLVVSVERSSSGFNLRLDDGETIPARRVVLAVGITHFEYVPEVLGNLPPEFLSHAARHHDLEPFRGQTVAVIGGGASATDLAGLLHDVGAEVHLIARKSSLKFHSTPTGKPRSLWQQIRHPKSGLGPGWRSRFYSNAPMMFYYLPESLRLSIVRTSLGPSGGWFSKEKAGRVNQWLGQTLERAEIKEGKVNLQLRAEDGSVRELVTDHVIAATGYRVDLERLTFLSKDIRSQLTAVSGAPALSPSFESSLPGLFFVGIAAANSFGPVMRFAFGAGFAAQTVTRALAKSVVQSTSAVPVRSAATAK